MDANEHVTASDGPEALAERIFGAYGATGELFSMYLGDRLGYYQAMADGSSLSSRQLAECTNTAERYAREWLEQQAVTGLLEVTDPGTDASSRQFRLPAGHAEVLVNPESLYYLAPFTRAVVGMSLAIPDVLEAFRTGGGVPYEAYGEDVREGIAGGNRAPFLQLLLSGSRQYLTCTHACMRTRRPVSPTSGAAPGGRASPSPRHISTSG